MVMFLRRIHSRSRSGQVFHVGDNADFCQSLACKGGIAGPCERDTSGPWVVRSNGLLSGRRVECNPTPPTLSLQIHRGGVPLLLLGGERMRSRVWMREESTGRVWLRLEGAQYCLPEHSMGQLCFAVSVQGEERLVRACSTTSPQLWSSQSRKFTLKLGSLELAADIFAAYPPSPPQPPRPPSPPPHPPSPLPPSPPPLSKQLSSDTCNRMLESHNSLFNRMWAVEPRAQKKPHELACWDVRRDNWDIRAPSGQFFEEVKRGSFCKTTDWYGERAIGCA